MTRFSWGTPGERYFEDGVDQGVLYVDGVGYVWNGLVSVTESPSGGEHRGFYLDGVKYLSFTTGENYEATIKAISSPSQFALCDGTRSLYQGLSVTQQPRKPFGFSYRTMINTDQTPDAGYKLHLVYNAMAAPSERNNASRSSSPELTPLSWYIQAVPPAFVGGFKPSAHFVIDSRNTPGEILTQLEDILYGSESADSRFPSQDEVLTLFEVNATVRVTDNGDGTFTVEGPDDVVTMTDSTTFSITWPSAVMIDTDSYHISSL